MAVYYFFDNTYNGTAGSGVYCNKLLLHNTTSFNGGFGIENGALVHQSGGEHRFYTGTTSTVYGTNRFNIYGSGVNVTGDYYDDGRIIQDHLFNNLGRTHGTFTDFNSPSDFGCHFIQGSTNGPNTNSSQYYEMTMGLGSDYVSGTSRYALQLAYNRYNEPYMSMRRMEGGSWGGWQRVYAGQADTITASGYTLGDFGIRNSAPVSVGTGSCNVHIGRCGSGAYYVGSLSIAQDFNNGSVRQMRIGYDNSFNMCIGDWGGSNANNTWTIPFNISYAAPSNSLYIQSGGSVIMPYGYSTSDQKN